MNDLKEILWYLLPGGFVVFPLLLRYSTKESLAGAIIFSALLVGFVIHVVFRIFFYYQCYGERKVSVYFKSIIKRYLREGKVTYQQLGITSIDRPRELEKVYNFYIFSNPKFKSYHEHIHKQSVTLSGLWSTLIALVVGFLVGVMVGINVGIIYILYALSFFIILWFIKITDSRMNDHEIYLIDKIDFGYKEKIFNDMPVK